MSPPTPTRLLAASACLAAATLGPALVAGPALASPNGIVISEFRTAGPNGGNDEFVEIANSSATDVDLSGYVLQGCAAGSGAASSRATVPAGVVLRPGQRYMFTNPGTTSSPGYSGGVPGDRTYTTGIADLNNNGSGIRLLNASAAVIDGVGAVGTVANACREGAGVNSAGVTTSLERRAGGVQDTDDNATDFQVTASAMPQNQASMTPPPVIPEVPAAVLLPLSALALAGGAVSLLRRRSLRVLPTGV